MKKPKIARILAFFCLVAIIVSAFVVVGSRVFADSNIQISAFNANVAATSNTIYSHIKIANTGTTSINLSTVTVRYYYTEDGSQSQNFWCDWSPSGCSNVTGMFVSLPSAVTGADHYLQIGFTSGSGSLAAGASTEVQARVAKADWSNYNQSNDYSFNSSSSNYVPSNNVTGYISGTLSWGTEAGGTSTPPTPITGVTPTLGPVQTPTPTLGPVQTPTPTLGPVQTPTPIPTQVATPTPAPGGSEVDRYFPVGTPVSTMVSTASSLTQQQVKVLIEKVVNNHWSVIQIQLGFGTEAQAYAFFLGQATRESTLQGGLETGGNAINSGAGHSYGPLQAADTAYANNNPNYQPENDVPQLYQYSLTNQNFYDIGVSIEMGIRHLIHFHNQAVSAGYSGSNALRYALLGYNTGWITSTGVLTSYSDEIGALSGWYLNNGHLYDTAWTWTGDPRVDRSNPWSWYS